MRNDRAFTLVEVLISLVILFTAVVAASAVFKHHTFLRLKQESYQDVYAAVLSLKDFIETKDLSMNASGTETFNGFECTYSAKPLKTLRNYVSASEERLAGNSGSYELTLYNVSLRLHRDTLTREFSFLVTQYRGGSSPGSVY